MLWVWLLALGEVNIVWLSMLQQVSKNRSKSILPLTFIRLESYKTKKKYISWGQAMHKD